MKTDNKVDFLSAAVLVCDVKEPVVVPGLKIGDGALAVPREEFIKTRPTLTVSQLASVQYGGGGNVVLPASALGVNVGVMGYVGGDMEGGFFVGGMREHSVNIEGIISDPKFRTDVSFIPADETGRRAPITFCEDAGRYFDLLNPRVQEMLAVLRPRIIQISYSGLFDKGADMEGGQRLKRGVEETKRNIDEPLIMIDTHTYKTDPVRYDLLKPSLEVADMFVCSDDEVSLVLPRFGLSSGPTINERASYFMDYLTQNFCGKMGNVRFYAVTSPERTWALYDNGRGNISRVIIPNWFVTTRENIFDTTGAGDSWRAGLNAYILHHLDEFKAGNLNIAEAVIFANLVARLYISGPGVEAFKGYKYDHLISTVFGKKPKTDLTPLHAVYRLIDERAAA